MIKSFRIKRAQSRIFIFVISTHQIRCPFHINSPSSPSAQGCPSCPMIRGRSFSERGKPWVVKAISSGASGLVSVNIPSVMPYDCWTAQEKAAESLLASFAVNRAPPTWMDSRLERSTGYQSSASIQRFTADGTAVIVVTFAEEINGNTSSGLTLSAKMTVPPFLAHQVRRGMRAANYGISTKLLGILFFRKKAIGKPLPRNCTHS